VHVDQHGYTPVSFSAFSAFCSHPLIGTGINVPTEIGFRYETAPGYPFKLSHGMYLASLPLCQCCSSSTSDLSERFFIYISRS
jgi:hypothetical protein